MERDYTLAELLFRAWQNYYVASRARCAYPHPVVALWIYEDYLLAAKHRVYLQGEGW